MGPWWTRDKSGRVEALDEAWLSNQIRRAAHLAGQDHPHWPLWQAELVSGAAHFIEPSNTPGEVFQREDLIDRLACALRELGQPALGRFFPQACQTDHPALESGPESRNLIQALLGADIADLVARGWFQPILPAGQTDYSLPLRVLHARLYLPGCPDVARALVRLIQTAAWCSGEIHLIGAPLWMEELGIGPGRGLEAFDLLEEAALALGKKLRLHLALGPGAAPNQSQMGLFFFGSSQGLSEPTLALQQWLAEKGKRLAVTGWIPPQETGQNREAAQAMASLAELACPGRPVRVVRYPQFPDLLAQWGPARKQVDAVLGGVHIHWDALAKEKLSQNALNQLVTLAVRAGCRLRQALRLGGKSAWPYADTSALWRMAWIVRLEGAWPAEWVALATDVASKQALSLELPLIFESEAMETASVLDARPWRSSNRIIPSGEGPWTFWLDEKPEPEIPGMA